LITEHELDAWIVALKSGKYPQITMTLRNKNGYCSMGVLCDISGKGKWSLYKPKSAVMQSYDFIGEEFLVISTPPKGWLDVEWETELGTITLTTHLMTLNDREKWSFSQIADFLDTEVRLRYFPASPEQETI